MQRTARRAREIVAFLNVGINRALYQSIGAPPLMPRSLGRQAIISLKRTKRLLLNIHCFDIKTKASPLTL